MERKRCLEAEQYFHFKQNWSSLRCFYLGNKHENKYAQETAPSGFFLRNSVTQVQLSF